MSNSGRNERIMRLRHRGRTYAEIGRDPEIKLGERQVQRIVKSEEHQRQKDLEVLQAKVIPRDPRQTDCQRAKELLEILEGSFKSISAVAYRYDATVSESFLMRINERRFGPACTELRALLRDIAETGEFGTERA